MINVITGNLRNVLDAMGRTDKASSIRAGTVVKAEVVDITKGGNAVLRLVASNTGSEQLQKTLIQANTDVPLTKGQYIFLEILGDKNDLTMRFIGDSRGPSGALQKDLPSGLIDLLTKLSGSKLDSADHKLLSQMLKSLPNHIKAANPELKNLENLLLDAKQVNSKQLAGSARILLTLTGQADRALSIRAGTIVRAQVIKISDDGAAVLRLTAPDSLNETVEGATIKTNSLIPFTKGQNIFVEVLGGREHIRMRLVGSPETQTEAIQQNIPVNYLDMLARISESRLNSSDFRLLLNMMRGLPQNIKTAIPELRNLENLLFSTKQLDGKILKAFIESSGVAYETKLKIAVLSDPGSIFQSLLALQTEGDLKSALLKLRKMLRNQNVINSLKEADLKTPELSRMVDKFINNIEIYQLTSKVNDMFYTFLPLMWDHLRDGECMFKKNRGGKDDSYTCDINLDLESIGKLAISVTISDKAFYVSFHAERHEVEELIKKHRHTLEEKFSSQGLLLRALNIGRKRHISFGQKQQQGINVKI